MTSATKMSKSIMANKLQDPRWNSRGTEESRKAQSFSCNHAKLRALMLWTEKEIASWSEGFSPPGGAEAAGGRLCEERIQVGGTRRQATRHQGVGLQGHTTCGGAHEGRPAGREAVLLPVLRPGRQLLLLGLLPHVLPPLVLSTAVLSLHPPQHRRGRTRPRTLRLLQRLCVRWLCGLLVKVSRRQRGSGLRLRLSVQWRRWRCRGGYFEDAPLQGARLRQVMCRGVVRRRGRRRGGLPQGCCQAYVPYPEPHPSRLSCQACGHCGLTIRATWAKTDFASSDQPLGTNPDSSEQMSTLQ